MKRGARLNVAGRLWTAIRTNMKKTELEKILEAKTRQEAAQPEQAPAPSLDEVLKERDDLSDRLLRLRAEFENYRKRIDRDTERMRHLAAEKLLRDLLPIVDHLELALAHKDDQSGALAEGVALVARQFHEVLRRHGLEPIPAQGEPFNPEVHEAVMQQPSEDHPSQTVLQEFQRGYRLGPVVLRPTKVVVSHRPSESEAVENGDAGRESAPEAGEGAPS
jgi:molecular chaperone GrpE